MYKARHGRENGDSANPARFAGLWLLCTCCYAAPTLSPPNTSCRLVLDLKKPVCGCQRVTVACCGGGNHSVMTWPAVRSDQKLPPIITLNFIWIKKQQKMDSSSKMAKSQDNLWNTEHSGLSPYRDMSLFIWVHVEHIIGDSGRFLSTWLAGRSNLPVIHTTKS